MPQQGVSSVFTFGQNYGMLRGILAALKIRREFVTPSVWQKAMGCITRSGIPKTAKKNFHKTKAQELFPGLKITHAIADALLICEFAKRSENFRRASDEE
jgi:crossover junction endodeoxyribonuclease RuvC